MRAGREGARDHDEHQRQRDCGGADRHSAHLRGEHVPFLEDARHHRERGHGETGADEERVRHEGDVLAVPGRDRAPDARFVEDRRDAEADHERHDGDGDAEQDDLPLPSAKEALLDLEPDEEHEQDERESRQQVQELERLKREELADEARAGVLGPVATEPPSRVGPSRKPATISPITRGWWSFTNAHPTRRATATISARSRSTKATTSVSVKRCATSPIDSDIVPLVHERSIVGLLHPGEMGAAVGRAVLAEVVWASDGRSEATRQRAAGFKDVGSVDELVRSSEIVLSICPPAIAEDVARQVFDLGFDGIYVEANAISPERMRRIATLRPRVVDGSIIAASGINLYLAGDGAERVAELFANDEVRAIALDAPVGAASALKMAFGGWNKIGIALTSQAQAIARAYGVTEQLEAEGVPADRLQGVADRAWRWAPEMEEIADMCRELGLSEAIPRGAASFYRELSEKSA